MIDFTCVEEAELVWLVERRRRAKIEQSEPRRALALSGGGVRAASVSRGFVHSLHANNQFDSFDYLSTVSGGGYFGASLTEHIGRNGGTLPLPNRLLKYSFQIENSIKTKVPDPLPVLKRSLVARSTRSNISIFRHREVFQQPANGDESSGEFERNYCDYSVVAPSYSLKLVIIAALEMVSVGPLLLYLTLLTKEFSHNESILFGIKLVFIFILSVWAYFDSRDRSVLVLVVIFILCTFLQSFYNVILLLAIYVLLRFTFSAYIGIYPHRTADLPIKGIYSYITYGGYLVFANVFSFLLTIAGAYSSIESTLSTFSALGILAFIATKRNLSSDVNDWNKNGIFSYYSNVLAEIYLPDTGYPAGWWIHSQRSNGNPYHIINSSVNDGISLSSFEIAPCFSGGPQVGYGETRLWLPKMTLQHALAISGSAADFHASPFSFLAILLKGTGFWIKRLDARNDVKLLLPLQNLLLHTRRKTHSLWLSDGGFVDNLGLLPLIRRRIPEIVCLDCGYDPFFDFNDLTKICVQVRRDGLAVLNFEHLSEDIIKLRFAASNRGIIKGEIFYPKTGKLAPFKGKIYIVKLRDCINTPERFLNFPHFPTSDQQLPKSVLNQLVNVGYELGNNFQKMLI